MKACLPASINFWVQIRLSDWFSRHWERGERGSLPGHDCAMAQDGPTLGLGALLTPHIRVGYQVIHEEQRKEREGPQIPSPYQRIHYHQHILLTPQGGGGSGKGCTQPHGGIYGDIPNGVVYHPSYDKSRWRVLRDKAGPMRDVPKRASGLELTLPPSYHDASRESCPLYHINGLCNYICVINRQWCCNY